LFAFGQQIAGQADLILADTKYEFGYDQDGQLILIDEMHTPDSSRFWERSTYETRVAEGADPESLDKEPIRRALAGLGYTGDGPPPDLGVDVIEATSTRYIKAFERITGDEFLPGEYPVGDRIKSALKSKGVL
jgi:phosphoribosylaminoimidazole-succinocarboxamide synthase